MCGRSKLARQAGGGGHVVLFTLYRVPCQKGFNLICPGQSVSFVLVNVRPGAWGGLNEYRHNLSEFDLGHETWVGLGVMGASTIFRLQQTVTTQGKWGQQSSSYFYIVTSFQVSLGNKG